VRSRTEEVISDRDADEDGQADGDGGRVPVEPDPGPDCAARAQRRDDRGHASTARSPLVRWLRLGCRAHFLASGPISVLDQQESSVSRSRSKALPTGASRSGTMSGK
jgi:hypothetical protein